MARVIFLHGASSAGKSTLARALQQALPDPWWHVSIDKLRDAGVLPLARFATGEFDWTAARAPFFDGFHASLGAYAAAGNDLILEHILDTPGWLADLTRILAEHDVLFVALHCPAEGAGSPRSRPGRPPGRQCGAGFPHYPHRADL